MTVVSTLDNGREAFRRFAWAEAYDLLSACDRESPLEPEDKELLATAAYLVGKDRESIDIWKGAHHEFLGRGQVERAARCAFWLAFELFNRKEETRGSAWIARARRLLDEGGHDCVELGYLLLPEALELIDRGDAAGACSILGKAAAICDRYGDRDLFALVRHSWGRALIRMGKNREGVAMLDEAMVAVEAGDVSPIVAGDVYCSMISGCLEIFDLRRASDWTLALTHWCESQPDMVAFNGICQVHRAEILRMHGAWPDAMEATEKACKQCLDGPDQAVIGAAYYSQAELHMLRGDLARAEDSFRQAGRSGRKPQPGLSLLRLAQGRVEKAEASIRNAVEQAHEPRARARVLPACVEIMLEAGDVRAARLAADELKGISDSIEAPFLQAVSAQAQGAVCLGEGNPRSALTFLRHAWMIWRKLEAPYEAARVRVLLGVAHLKTGDEDTAEMEFDAARWVFQELGAAPDLKRIDSLTGRTSSGDTHGLTPREMEVLRLVAAGKTNKAVATELFISERTVDRHVSNIFMKLDVASRTEATSYAYKHELI